MIKLPAQRIVLFCQKAAYLWKHGEFQPSPYLIIYLPGIKAAAVMAKKLKYYACSYILFIQFGEHFPFSLCSALADNVTSRTTHTVSKGCVQHQPTEPF